MDKQDIRFDRLSVGGEPFNKRVLAIAQDNHGFVWLGTDDGLYRYDGYSLRAYRHDPCRAQKHFGSEIGRSAPTRVTRKAESFDQSDSSILVAAASKDTLPSCTVVSISFSSPPTSGSDFLDSVLMMKATENRFRHHSVSFGKLMPKFLLWRLFVAKSLCPVIGASVINCWWDWCKV